MDALAVDDLAYPAVVKEFLQHRSFEVLDRVSLEVSLHRGLSAERADHVYGRSLILERHTL